MAEHADTLLRCAECGRERRVSFAHCLSHGWPTCTVEWHGSMAVVDVDLHVIEAAVEEKFAPISDAIAAANATTDAPR